MKYLKLVLMCLLIGTMTMACRTKKATEKSTEKWEKVEKQNNEQTQQVAQTAVEKVDLTSEIQELRSLVSNFKIDYKGQDLDDKLVILMQKDKQGSKLTFEGKGEVNLTEHQKSAIETQFKQHLKRQDSVYSAIITKLDKLQHNYAQAEKSKEKQVTKTGFKLGVYLWLILILALVFLAWRFKVFQLLKKLLAIGKKPNASQSLITNP
ncbi:hypothetical protein [Capnocytophaga canis]|uniref:hypothetical protein n=1 Tax=Capnocytophaga canis TaxID=1848903 RepID=UPI0015620AC6|nr:hypothetical protein [Capnocytophaga canis]